VLREEVDKNLVGGMALYVGDQRLDATVTGTLERLKQTLLA
jgi:F0F1-type ATP synthase delta subunit